MLMPAALVGPTRLSAFCLRARPGESMDRTSMDVALAAKTYMKLDIDGQRRPHCPYDVDSLLAVDGGDIEINESRSRSQWEALRDNDWSVTVNRCWQGVRTATMEPLRFLSTWTSVTMDVPISVK